MTTKVAIAIPENRDVILKGMFWGFIKFLSSIQTPVVLLGNEDDCMVPGKTSYIDSMRNRLVERAKKLDCTHILFIDSDTIPPAGALEKLLEADQDIIGGVYRFRVPPYRVLAFWYLDGHYVPMDKIPEDEVIAVDGIGMGCTLIKMDVFDKVEMPWYYAGYIDYVSPYDKRKKIEDFERRFIGEDLHFCEKAFLAGYKIHLHTGVKADHITQIFIPGSTETPEIPFINKNKNQSEHVPITFGG